MRPKGESQKLNQAVLVTGSAGFIGQNLVRVLAEKGKTVVSVYRHKVPDSLEGTYPVCSDLSSPALMAAPLRGIETVVHLAWDGGLAGPSGVLPQDPFEKKDLLTRNLRTIQNLINAMERANTKRIVFLSAVGASQEAKSSFLQEKYLAELMVLNSSIPEKVILRSSVVWGGHSGNDPFINSINRLMRFMVYPLPRKRAHLAPLHVSDLISVLVAVAEGQIKLDVALIDIVGGEKYDIAEFFKLFSESIIKKTRFPLRGAVGETLLPWLERHHDERTPRLQQFLCLSTPDISHVMPAEENLLKSIILDRLPSFRERIHQSSSKFLDQKT